MSLQKSSLFHSYFLDQATLASIVSEIFDIEYEFVGSLLSKVAKVCYFKWNTQIHIYY